MSRPSPNRVVARVAEMTPPLGFPGGPCQVIDRIQHAVPNLRLREEFIDDVEQGVSLTNPEAARVYHQEIEQLPAGLKFERLLVGPHAAYRMDLRGIDVPLVRAALRSLAKRWNDLRSQQSPIAKLWDTGEPFTWTDPKLKLTIVLAHDGRSLKLVTTYWQGDPDPRPPGEGGCTTKVGYDPSEDNFGEKTLVSPKSEKNLPTDMDREKQQVLPPGSATPNSPKKNDSAGGGGGNRELPEGQFNKPDDTTKITERPRTLPTPGEEYGNPTKFDYNYVTRRDMTATEVEAYKQRVPWKRQRRQRVFKRVKDKREYKTKRNRVLMRMKRWYRSVHRNPTFKRLKEKRTENPKRYTRRLAHTDMDLPMLFGRAMAPGDVLRLGPDGSVVFRLDGAPAEQSLPVDIFLATATLDREGIDELFDAFDEAEVEYPDASAAELRAFADRAGLDPTSDSFLSRVHDLTGKRELDLLNEDELGEVEDAIVDGLILPQTAKTAYVPTSLSTRRHRQRGHARTERRHEYRHNRARAHRQGHMWYKRNHNRPQFKRRQQIRRSHPQRFRLRYGMVDIAFVAGPEMIPGHLQGVSAISGLVEIVLHLDEDQVLALSPLAFLSAVVFLSENDLHEAMSLIDTTLGPDAYDTIDQEDVPALSELLQLEPEAIMGAINSADPLGGMAAIVEVQEEVEDLETRQAAEVILYDQRPPGDLSDNWMNRGETSDDSLEPSDDANTPYREVGPRTGPKQTRKPTPGGITEGPDRTLPSGSGKVIPEELKQQDRFAKTATLISDILDGTIQVVHDRAKKRAVKVRRADPARGIWTFDVTGGEDTYRVRVKGLKDGNVKQMRAMDIEVSCTCPFYRWQGPEHWAVAEDYMYGKPQGTASFPKIRDPGRTHLTCKHGILALQLAMEYQSVPAKPSPARVASRFDSRGVCSAACFDWGF